MVRMGCFLLLELVGAGVAEADWDGSGEAGKGFGGW